MLPGNAQRGLATSTDVVLFPACRCLSQQACEGSTTNLHGLSPRNSPTLIPSVPCTPTGVAASPTGTPLHLEPLSCTQLNLPAACLVLMASALEPLACIRIFTCWVPDPVYVPV